MHKVLVLLLPFLLLGVAPNLQAQTDQVQQLKGQPESIETDSIKINTIVEMAQNAIQRGEMESARKFLARARHLADSIDFDHGRQQMLYGLGDFYLVQQKFDSAETVLQQAMDLNPVPPLRSQIQNLLATSYRYQGKNRRAIDSYRDILSEIDTTENVRTAAGISQNMADAYINIGLAAEAFKHYTNAIKYAEAAKDSAFLATALNNIGNAYNSEENYGEAAYYLERSLQISQSLNHKPGQLRALLNLGITRSNQSRYQDAESLFNRALALWNEVRPDVPPVQLHYNLGDLYSRMGRHGEAESYFRQSLEASRQAGIPQGIYYNSGGLGMVAENQGALAEAEDWFAEALKVAKTLNNPSFLQETHQSLYQLHKKQGSFEAALEHLESFKTISDSLKTQERERMLAEYQTKLEVQRRDQQNEALQSESDRQQALLQRQAWLIGGGLLVLVIIAVFAVLLYKANQEKNVMNRKLEERKAELEELDELKNRLFGIVAHDLRSPLSSLLGMLELFRDRALTEEDMRELMAELELSLQQNVNVMENLLVWAEQQMSGLSVDMKPQEAYGIARDILEAHSFSAKHKNIAVENKLEPNLMVHADYNMLKLVIRNLISNAIKFSENGDRIVLNATKLDGKVRFEVCDTGIGIPEEIQKRIFTASSESRKGTRDERGSGMGLNLCKEFLERQGGEIYFESEVGEGSKFFFTLPVAN